MRALPKCCPPRTAKRFRHLARPRVAAASQPSAGRRNAFGEKDSGFTLLEIILALAILAGALAALGEVMRLGDQNAALTRDETQAQILASSVMDELLAGVRPLSSVSNATLDLPAEPPWAYSIEITPSPQHVELLVIRVRVQQQLDPMLQPARYDLARWVLDPGLMVTSTSSTTGAGTSGSSGSSTGGGSR